MSEDEIFKALAEENGFSLYKSYTEQQAAAFLHKDLSTVKRYRRKNLIRFRKIGDKNIYYLGIDIAHTLLHGTRNNGGNGEPA